MLVPLMPQSSQLVIVRGKLGYVEQREYVERGAQFGSSLNSGRCQNQPPVRYGIVLQLPWKLDVLGIGSTSFFVPIVSAIGAVFDIEP